MAKLTITRVHAMSAAVVVGLWYAALGVVAGAFLSLAALIGALGSLAGDGEGALPAICLGPVALVAAPLLYGALGFVCGLLSALFYNLIARLVGGVVIETSACE